MNNNLKQIPYKLCEIHMYIEEAVRNIELTFSMHFDDEEFYWVGESIYECMKNIFPDQKPFDELPELKDLIKELKND